MATNFQHGLSSYGIPVIGAGASYGAPGSIPLINTGGTMWFVSSTLGNNGNPGTFTQPFATLAFAAAYPNLKSGDVIVVIASHVENVTTAGAITIPSGVDVIGQGVDNGRPLFTFTTANASILFPAGNNYSSLDNVVGTSNLASTSNVAIDIANNIGTRISNFTWQDVTGKEAIHVIRASHSNNVVISNYQNRGLANGTVRVSDVILNNCSFVSVQNFDYWGNNSTAIVQMITNASRAVEVTGTAWINGTSTGTKFVSDGVGTSTWYSTVFDGYAGQYVEGSSATGNGASGTFTSMSGVNISEKVIQTGSSATVLNTAGVNTAFTVSGGPIKILDLVTVCSAPGTSANIQFCYQVTTTTPAGTVLLSANTTNATSVTNGTVFSLPAAFATNTVSTAAGVSLSVAPSGGIYCPIGSIQTNVSTICTGTYTHYLRYKPLSTISVVANTF